MLSAHSSLGCISHHSDTKSFLLNRFTNSFQFVLYHIRTKFWDKILNLLSNIAKLLKIYIFLIFTYQLANHFIERRRNVCLLLVPKSLMISAICSQSKNTNVSKRDQSLCSRINYFNLHHFIVLVYIEMFRKLERFLNVIAEYLYIE